MRNRIFGPIFKAQNILYTHLTTFDKKYTFMICHKGILIELGEVFHFITTGYTEMLYLDFQTHSKITS